MNESHIIIVLATVIYSFFRSDLNLPFTIANAIVVAILITLFPNNLAVTLFIFATILIIFPNALSTMYAHILGTAIYFIFAFIKKMLFRPFPKLSAHIDSKAKRFLRS